MRLSLLIVIIGLGLLAASGMSASVRALLPRAARFIGADIDIGLTCAAPVCDASVPSADPWRQRLLWRYMHEMSTGI